MTSQPTLPELRRIFRENPLALLGAAPGIVPVNKPAGMTSHDVVDLARRRMHIRKAGHGGTLDPMAEGVLLILTGRATRLFEEIRRLPKTYRAGFRLGRATDTQDATGAVVAEAAAEALPVPREAAERALEAFRGEILQTPPMYSALKKNGTPLYKLAREGKTVEREPRRVHVYDLALAEFDGTSGILETTVSGGFYVRTLAHDLGEALGAHAHMTSLVRTAVGPFALADAVRPEALADLAKERNSA